MDSRSFCKGDEITFTYNGKERDGVVDAVHANRVTLKMKSDKVPYKSFLYSGISNLRVNAADENFVPFGWNHL